MNSINNAEDCKKSAAATLPQLLLCLPKYDGFLICCYSDHPLVRILKTMTKKPVIGILEGSVSAALLLLPSEDSTFGIISTGEIWETLLKDAVNKYLGATGSSKFAGVKTCGLSAIELHDTHYDEVRLRIKEATRKLLRSGPVEVIILGCAGMAGMNEAIREACVEVYGNPGNLIRIVDGVKVGYGILTGLVSAGF